MASVKSPLVVDLDGTLLKNDSLIEMFIAGLLKQPWVALKALLMLLQGRSAFKRKIFETNQLEVGSLPLREDFLEFLHEQKQSGRELFLVTAADQGLADVISNKLGIFEFAQGSADGNNLKGRQKLDYLQKRFPDGFAYAGDSSADIPIWRKARSIILVGTSKTTRRSVQAMKGTIERDFITEAAGLGTWLKALRLHQWSKNVLIFVPLFLAHQFTNGVAIAHVSLAFLCMSFVASGTYLINDLSDLDADRRHKTKRHRAIASGAIGAGTALVVAVAAIMAGLAGAIYVSLNLFLVVLVYLAVTLSYSMHIKQIAMLDVVTLGALYTLRVLIGTVVIGSELSPWLLTFSLFFFLSLSLAKRYIEIAGRAGEQTSNEIIAGRGYRVSDGPLILAFGVSTSVVSVLILTLYVANEAFPVDAYSNPYWLWLMTPIILLWTMRIWLVSYRVEMHDDPVIFAIKDKVSWGLGILVFLTFLAATI